MQCYFTYAKSRNVALSEESNRCVFFLCGGICSSYFQDATNWHTFKIEVSGQKRNNLDFRFRYDTIYAPTNLNKLLHFMTIGPFSLSKARVSQMSIL